MELCYVGLDDLDHPVHKVDHDTLFSCQPFFNDYYVVLYLKKVSVPRPAYKPIVVNDRDLVIDYGARDLSSLVAQVVGVGEQARSNTFMIRYRILVLLNGWWCVYIEKRHVWGDFQSLGVITLISPSKTATLSYFQEYFAPKLTQKHPHALCPNRNASKTDSHVASDRHQ